MPVHIKYLTGAQLIFLSLKFFIFLFLGFGKDSLKIFDLFFGLTIMMQFILFGVRLKDFESQNC